jgi:hypothetical protein
MERNEDRCFVCGQKRSLPKGPCVSNDDFTPEESASMDVAERERVGQVAEHLAEPWPAGAELRGREKQ